MKEKERRGKTREDKERQGKTRKGNKGSKGKKEKTGKDKEEITRTGRYKRETVWRIGQKKVNRKFNLLLCVFSYKKGWCVGLP